MSRQKLAGYSSLQPHEVEPGGEDLTRQGVEACPWRALFIDEDN